MAVYGEWHWSCDLCDDTSEEPWGDPQAARDEYDEHVRYTHPEHPNRSQGASDV